nr:MAG TPA: hypothetical protein [Caudoviricetes sp.]
MVATQLWGVFCFPNFEDKSKMRDYGLNTFRLTKTIKSQGRLMAKCRVNRRRHEKDGML